MDDRDKGRERVREIRARHDIYIYIYIYISPVIFYLSINQKNGRSGHCRKLFKRRIPLPQTICLLKSKIKCLIAKVDCCIENRISIKGTDSWKEITSVSCIAKMDAVWKRRVNSIYVYLQSLSFLVYQHLSNHSCIYTFRAHTRTHTWTYTEADTYFLESVSFNIVKLTVKWKYIRV